MKAIILAGGSGLRLWPLSKKNKPKQFLDLISEKSMLIDTIERNKEFIDEFFIMTNLEYNELVIQELRKVEGIKYQIILEEIGKNTTIPIAICSSLCEPNDLILTLPADAYIGDLLKYKKSVHEAIDIAEDGNIVTFGIKPNSPHTGYGYIKHNEYDVTSFVEKPNSELAVKYLNSGDYLWNSGMFLFKSSVLNEELKLYVPKIYEDVKKIIKSEQFIINNILSKSSLKDVESISIDYSVMEKSKKIKVVPSDFSWNDVGELEALSTFGDFDIKGNKTLGKDIVLNNCVNVSVINKCEDQSIVLNEIEDILIANTKDSVYITKSGKSGEIKKIYEDNKSLLKKYFEDVNIQYMSFGSITKIFKDDKLEIVRYKLLPGNDIEVTCANNSVITITIIEGIATTNSTTDELYSNDTIKVNFPKPIKIVNSTNTNLEFTLTTLV